MNSRDYMNNREEKLICFKNIKDSLPSFFSISGYPKKSFQLKIQVFHIDYNMNDDGTTDFWAKIHSTGKEYNLLDPDDSFQFIVYLKRYEIPRFIAKDLLQDSYNNRHIVEDYLGDNDEESIQKITLDSDLMRLCISICDHWKYIGLIGLPLIIEKDTEIDELEDFRYLANKIREYLSTQVPDIQFYWKFSFREPEYSFL